MSQLKSPRIAARQAERAAEEAEQLRKEDRKSRLMLIGVVLLMATSTTAYFVFYAIPRWTKPHRHQHRQHG